MSALISRCDRCHLDRIFLRLLSVQPETAYGIEWACPRCGGQILDICPIGPAAPGPQSCLACGSSFADPGDFAKCPRCNMTRLGTRDLFGLHSPPDDVMRTVELLCDLGLVRRAMATLDDALVRDPTFEPAWRSKYAFLSGLAFRNAALAVIEAATEHVVNPDLLISYAHLLQGLGRLKDARDVYREYLATAPAGEYAGLAQSALSLLEGGAR